MSVRPILPGAVLGVAAGGLLLGSVTDTMLKQIVGATLRESSDSR